MTPSTELLDVAVRFTGGPLPRGEERLQVPKGTPLRSILRQLGLRVEGVALWWEGEPVPTDLPVERSGRLEIVHTFSGG